jgi:hypothetical protein
MPVSDYIIGLDLGQPHEFTALAVLERSTLGSKLQRREDWQYTVPHLRRFPIGTPYTEIVPAALELANKPPLRGAPLVVDQTGVGAAIVEMIRQAPRTGSLVPVNITNGQMMIEQEDYSFAVPKKDLAGHVQVLLQQRRLKIARALPDAEMLVSELQTFRVKPSLSATEVLDAWRERDHDDLVLAVALACWWAEQSPPWGDDAFGGSSESLLANLPPGLIFEGLPDSWMDKRF